MTHAHDEDENMLAAPAGSETPKLDSNGLESAEVAVQKWLDWCVTNDEEPSARSGATEAIRAYLASAPPVEGVAGLCPKCAGTGRGNGSSVACFKCEGTGAIVIRADLTVGTEAKTFQDRVQPWMMACFGAEISGDKVERGDRLLEEVLELLQSGGYDPARVGALRDYVWSRPGGEPAQEVGGVEVTLAAYCLAFGLDMHAAGEAELARIWTKVDKIRAKQAAKPVGSALPVVAPSAEPNEQKAVAWRGIGEDNVSEVTDRADIAGQWLSDGIDVEPLYLAPPPSGDRGSVKVKALKWYTPVTSTTLSRADTDFGVYRVWANPEPDGRWFWNLDGHARIDGEAPYETSAKAAAQADYEQRILSALTTEGADHD